MLFALLLVAQASPFLAGPPGAEVLVESDVVTYGWEGDVVRFQGHVIVRRADGELRASSGTYDRRAQRVSLEGDVLGVQGRQVFLADRADVDLAARTADLASATLFLKERPASIDSPRAGRNALTLHGKQVRQLGPGAFVATGVALTPCDCAGEPDYQLLAKSARIEGDRAFLESPRLELLGAQMPLFPLSLPLSSRQSGLLAPSLGFTGLTGFGYSQPIFVTLGKSYDATISPGFFTGLGRTNDPSLGMRSVRGPRLGTELRYAPFEGTTGSLSLELLQDLDQAASPGRADAGIAEGRGFSGLRGVLRASHRTETGAGTFALDGAWASDNMFFRDTLPLGFNPNTDVLRTDAGFLRARDALSVGAAASLLEDLRVEDPSRPDRRLVGGEHRDTFQRLPALFAQLAPVDVLGMTLSAEASAAQYVSPFGADAHEQATGFAVADAGATAAEAGWPDPARRPAVLLDASPRLGLAGPADLPVALSLEVGGRADAWLVEGAPDQHRTRVYGLADARASLPLERTFGARVHRIEPGVEIRALTKPLRSGADPIGDPADAGGPYWSAWPDAAEQGLAPGLPRDVGVTQGVPSSRRAYSELDGAAPSTGALQASFSLAQSLWERAGRTSRRVVHLDLQQDVLLAAAGTRARLDEASALASFQAGPLGVQGLARFDWRTRAVTALVGSLSASDAGGDEVHASTSLLRAGTASGRARAGIDELFATAIPAIGAGDLSGLARAGISAPVPIGRPGLRLGYEADRNLGYVPANIGTWVHRLIARVEPPCRCAAVAFTLEAPLREGRLVNGPHFVFVLDLKSLGSFATF